MRFGLGSLAPLLLLLAAGCSGCGAARINDVTTGRTPEYPALEPLRVGLSAPLAYAAAAHTAVNMPRWRDCVPEGHLRMHCEAVTPSGLFVDDVYLWVEAETGRSSWVFTRSASRVGQGDMGVNARRILEFQAALRRVLED